MDPKDPVVDSSPAGPAHGAALRDPETGLLGAEAWSAIVSTESARCKRGGRPATVVVVEVSGLEDLASVWGTDVGSSVAGRVGAVLRARVRTSDYAARIGPSRFAVLLTETDEIAAVNFVERVRDACDSALRSVESDARAWFGWADATQKRSLISAVELAMNRVDADRRANEADEG